MDKQETYRYLKDHGVGFEVTEHEAVYNMKEARTVKLPHPEAEAKNLFLRDDKKENYYLISVKGEKRMDINEFRHRYGLRRLRFAGPDELEEILNLTPGSVTPLGLLEDSERRVRYYIDKAFSDGLIGVHPNDNTATVFLKTEDLIRLIAEHGNPVEFTSI